MAELICARQRSSSVLNVLLKKEKLIVLPQIFPDVLDWNLPLKWDLSSPLAFQITQQTDRQTGSAEDILVVASIFVTSSELCKPPMTKMSFFGTGESHLLG